MSNQNTARQAGLGLVGVIAIVAVVGIIAAAGFVVFGRSKQDDSKSAVTSATEKAATTSKEQVAPPTAEPETPKKLEKYTIPELGVAFTLSEPIKDLTHVVKDIELSDGGKSKAAYFSTTALQKASAKCAASSVSIAAMGLGQGQYPTDGGLASDYGLLKQFPNSFVSYLTSRAKCTDGKDEKLEKLYSETVQALSESVKTVEQTN